MRESKNPPVLKDLAGKTADEKVELVKQWLQKGLIAPELAENITSKIKKRSAFKQSQRRAIIEAERNSHAFDALWNESTVWEIKQALGRLRDVLRMKRKAYLIDRYFNPELTTSERKALTAALKDITYKYFSYELGGILIEVLKYPVKAVKMEGNAFMEHLLQSKEYQFDFLLWARILGRLYVAKRQWQQMITYKEHFIPFIEIYKPSIKVFADKGDQGAIAVLKAYL